MILFSYVCSPKTFRLMNTTKFLPMWYAGGIGNNCNALKGVGQLTHMGFIPKLSDCEYKHPFTRNPTKVNGVF